MIDIKELGHSEPSVHESTVDKEDVSKVYKEFLTKKIELMDCEIHAIKEKRIRKLFTSGLLTLNKTLELLDLPLVEDGEKIRFGAFKELDLKEKHPESE